MATEFQRGQIVKSTGNGRTKTWPGMEFVIVAVRKNGNVLTISEEFKPDEVEFTGEMADKNHPALLNSDLWWRHIK